SRIQLDWFGGEPLLGFDSIVYPFSKKILELSKESKVLFSNQITTNGYLLDEKKIYKLNEIKLSNFQITLDGNESDHNKVKISTNSYKKTVNNLNLLCDIVENLELMLRINFTDESLKGCVDIIEDIPFGNRAKMKVLFQKVWQTLDKSDDSEELRKMKKTFSNAGFIISEYDIKPVLACYADRYEQSVVNFDGKVFKCTARDFTDENSDGFLDEDGDIQWDVDKQSRRFGVIAFEKYEDCKKCDLLPACYGPCSQKVLETDIDDFEKICNYGGIKSTIVKVLERNYAETFS
ncbi:MAG: SPASM domain-containing protein, partial [Bacteroidales bacterium]|nr:SPASM domain-containing protein [Bacteroidales bacterium]